MKRHLVSRFILRFALWLARVLSRSGWDRGPPPTPRGGGPGP
jgi:hypothetical protein